MKHDSTFALETTSCDGSDATVMANTECTMAVGLLRAAPFMLAWGQTVSAKIVATNLYGDSSASPLGTSNIIMTKPDAPILIEDTTQRTPTDIAVQWQEGVSNGGSPVIDYQLSYDQGFGTFVVVDSALTGTSYLFSGLITGTTYVFKLTSRNAYGNSDESSYLTLLCASIPFAVEKPTTSVTTDQVTITWNEPYASGSPITSYKVMIK